MSKDRNEMPPVLRELFLMLPPTGAEWPQVERLRWMRALEATCRLIFKDGEAHILIDLEDAARAALNHTKGTEP